MCIRQEFRHTICGCTEQTTQSCSDSSYPFTKDSTSIRRAFRVHVRSTEEALKVDTCRRCQMDKLMSQDPAYKLTSAWTRLSTEANLVAGYFATEARRRFNEQKTQAFLQRHAVIARRLEH